jgi:hypothetical protein
LKLPEFGQQAATAKQFLLSETQILVSDRSVLGPGSARKGNQTMDYLVVLLTLAMAAVYALLIGRSLPKT